MKGQGKRFIRGLARESNREEAGNCTLGIYIGTGR